MSERWPPIEIIINQAIGRDERIVRTRVSTTYLLDRTLRRETGHPVKRIETGVGRSLESGRTLYYHCPCGDRRPMLSIDEPISPIARHPDPVELRHQCWANTVRGRTTWHIDVWLGQCPECKTIWWEVR